ncbi:MAG: polyhydroxyalkanoate synthesis repressor PhaR [Pseudomonadales bacterium]
MITIKKYPNRRLYDTSQSTYVNLDYLLELIQKHQDFQVVDSKSGEDHTKAILLQIISDQETDEHRSLLTNTLLKQLIRFYNSDMQPFVRNYLEQSLASFLEQQETMQHMVKNMVDSSPANLFTRMMEQNMRLWNVGTGAGKSPENDEKSD